MTTGKAIALAIQTFGDWNAKVGSQVISGLTGNFGLGVQNEAEQSQTSFSKRTHWS